MALDVVAYTSPKAFISETKALVKVMTTTAASPRCKPKANASGSAGMYGNPARMISSGTKCDSRAKKRRFLRASSHLFLERSTALLMATMKSRLVTSYET